MFFRRNEGQYRETDRVTRFKLVKSGKHWLRAATSNFGLFKVLRGGVDLPSISTQQVEVDSSAFSGHSLLKGVLATGALLGGAVVTHVTHAEEVTDEPVLESQAGAKADLLVASESAVIGNIGSVSGVQESQVNSQESSEAASSQTSETSLNESLSSSQSISASEQASKSASLSLSASISTSLSASLASQSESASQTASHSLSESGLTGSSERDDSISNQSFSKSDSVASQEGVNLVSSDSAMLHASLASEALVNRQLSDTANGLLAVSLVSNTERSDQEKRLKDLALEIYTYKAQALDLPNTDAAILKGNQALDAIRVSLADSGVDIIPTLTQARQARNSLANAVLRATSGQRDPRNGAIIGADNSLRNPYYNLGPNNGLISAYNSDYINQAYQVVESKPTQYSIRSIGYTSYSDRVNGINIPQTTALRNSSVAFNVMGTVGADQVVTPGRTYTLSFVVANNANQTVTRSLRIQVLPQNDGIRNPIKAVTTGTFVNDTSNLAQAEKDKVWETFKATNPNIATSKDFKSYSVSATGVVTITYKDNTSNDVTAPVKRLPAPTVATRLLDKAYTQTAVTVTGAEPGSTVVLYNNDDEVGTAVANASGQAIVTPTVKLQTGGVTAKARIMYGNYPVYSDASNSVAVTDSTRPEVAAKLTVNGVEPKSTPLEGGGKNYIIYAGDDAVLTFTATDDSGKLKEMKIVARANLDDNALNGNFLGGTQYGTGNVAPITGDITATSANPATITTTIHLKDDLTYSARNTWQRNVAAIDNASNMNRPNGLGEIRMTQGRLADRTPGVAPTTTIQVTSLTALTETDKSKIIAAVSALNPEAANRIKSYTVNNDGTVTITYKDDTTNTVTVPLSNSDYSKSLSNSTSESVKQSASTSTSVSTVVSRNVSNSLKQSLSVSSSLSTVKSRSLSQSLSTSVRTSQSASTSESLSTVKSRSLSQSLSTSVRTSQSVSTSESLSTVKSRSLSQSLSTSVRTSQSVSTSASLSTVKSQSLSQSLSESVKTSVSRSESASTSASLSTVKSRSLSQSLSTSVRTSQSVSTSASLSTSKSQSLSQSLSESVKTSVSRSESASTSASLSTVKSRSLSQSLSTSVRTSQSVSTSASLSTVKSQSLSQSLSESVKTSVSRSESASASASLSTSKSQSLSQSLSESVKTSVSRSESASTSASLSTSKSQSLSQSLSESVKTSASRSESASTSASLSTSKSQSLSQSLSESVKTSVSRSESASTSASLSTSKSQSLSQSLSASVSTSQSVSNSLSSSLSTSVSTSESISNSLSSSLSTSVSTSQ
ncbi:accessory Sec-dependent serine-rich glycoprotein adhesin, partial [Streptococcus sp.]|uniref:accessory Sec-dependent serine-rich glycoprotein adhesin n=1 Tax=Streptococcus sp. TaxID=1306 RepID=UPI001D836DCB